MRTSSATLLKILASLSFAVLCSSSDGLQPVAATPTKARSLDGRYISWREHIIDDEARAGLALRGGDGLALADFDKDGFLDVVSVHEDSNHIRLAFGSKNPDRWRLVTLAEGDEARAAEDVAVGDLNGDAFPDVVVACEEGHIIYLQNPAKAHSSSKWPRLVLPMTRNRGSFIRVHLADVTGDGRLEIIGANKGWPPPKRSEKSPVSVFHVVGDPLTPKGWREQPLIQLVQPINSPAFDIDRDGDLDVLACDQGGQQLYWMINDGRGEFRSQPLVFGGTLKRYRGLRGFSSLFADLNGDGRPDIVTQGERGTLLWVEQPSSLDQTWPSHDIGYFEPDAVAGIAFADIDGDGARDIIGGGYSNDPRDHDGPKLNRNHPLGRIAWFRNPGQSGGPWVRHDITRPKRGMYDGFVPRDMDGDGDIDFIGTRGNSGNFDGVFWIEQVRTTKSVPAFRQARKTESEPMPLAETDRP